MLEGTDNAQATSFFSRPEEKIRSDPIHFVNLA